MFCSGFYEAKKGFRCIQNYFENKGMVWVLQDKQGVHQLVFSQQAFQSVEELFGRARSKRDARQFHVNTCCLTAGFRALSPSTFNLADSLGGKNVFKVCQLLSST